MSAALYCSVIFKYLKNYISVITVIDRPFSLGNLVVFLFHGTIAGKTAEKIYVLWGGIRKRTKKNTNYAN